MLHMPCSYSRYLNIKGVLIKHTGCIYIQLCPNATDVPKKNPHMDQLVVKRITRLTNLVQISKLYHNTYLRTTNTSFFLSKLLQVF